MGGSQKISKHLFPVGQLVMTPGALRALLESDQFPGEFIGRHVSGDWGDICEEDKKENDLSLLKGYRLFSVYHTKNGVRLWVITEADRSVTTILLPEEY